MAAAHIRGLECPRPAASVHHPSRSTSRNHAVVRLITRSDSTADGSGANRSADDKQGGNIRNHTRRGLLQLATAGSLHAWAGRNAQAADAQVTAAAAAAVAAGGGGSELLQRQLDDRLSQFTLPNGLRFIMYERKAAPIVSFHIYADVGAYDEVDGQTGLAHLLEHMAFKGTPRIGTTDYRAESPLLDALDEAFYSQLEAGSPKEYARLQKELEALSQQAAALSVPNAYGALLNAEGGVGLNAATSQDATKFYVSLPANKAELWFALESERFQAPVFRDLYTEKTVVLEERRLRVDNSALGPFSEQFALRSFSNNYRRPVIGFADDIARLGRREVQAFFQQHYGPQNLTIAVAGDVQPATIRRLAEKYFGSWQQPAGNQAAAAAGCLGLAGLEEALAVPTVSRDQWHYSAQSKAGPGVMQAYYRPCINSPDSVPLDLASGMLSGSRSSRLYRNLVLPGKALAASAYASLPADKHPSTFVCYGVPAKESSIKKLHADLSAEVAALAGEGPTADELRRYKKSAKVELLDALRNNSAIASALSSYQVLTGDCRNVLTDLRRIESLTGAEVREAAARHLRPDNCFKGTVLPL